MPTDIYALFESTTFNEWFLHVPQLSWVGETKALLSSDELGKDVRSAEEMSERHQELKMEIDNNEEKYVTQYAVLKSKNDLQTLYEYYGFVNISYYVHVCINCPHYVQ